VWRFLGDTSYSAVQTLLSKGASFSHTTQCVDRQTEIIVSIMTIADHTAAVRSANNNDMKKNDYSAVVTTAEPLPEFTRFT